MTSDTTPDLMPQPSLFARLSRRSLVSPGPRSDSLQPSRRTVLRVMVGAGAGLTLGLALPGAGRAAEDEGSMAETFAPNAFVRIAPDNTVAVICKHLEMGQGVFTGLSTLVAEELDAAWDQVRPEHAPADASLYNNLFMGPLQVTGGSTSLANAFEQMRRAGAVARLMLVRAAAEAWGEKAAKIEAAEGVLRHTASGREASFGEMATRAATLPVPDPESVTLKTPEQFRLIGKAVLRRPDAAAKIDGSAIFAGDVRLTGMLAALVRRPLRFGATLKTVDAAAALALPGVRAVFPISSGVAVVADTPWQAAIALPALNVTWDDTLAVTTGTKAILASYREVAKGPGAPVRNDGDAAAALADPDARVIEASYDVPYLAHAPMEPLSAVAHLTDSGIDVWAGSQSPTLDVIAIAEAAVLKPDQVTLHTTLAGGSFGRRASPRGDGVAEVAAIARGLADRGIVGPIQLVWSREDDIRGGSYRPMALHTVSGALDPNGSPVAWRHRVVCQSILKGTLFEAALMADGIDPTSIEGVVDLPYAVPNMFADLHSPDPGVPVLWWRSVGHSHTAFAVESFVDELAHAGGTDPLALRLNLLHAHPRLLGVLMLAAEKAGWGKPMGAGRGQGIAVHQSFGTFVAQVAEVTAGDKGIKVDRVVCAVDCGLPVNPDVIRAQIEGSVVFGLSAALRSRLTMDETGLVEQSNFHDYEILRMSAMPEIDVHIVPSTEPPTGIGEPGVPPVAPAVANAVFAATGKRLRSLPLRLK